MPKRKENMVLVLAMTSHNWDLEDERIGNTDWCECGLCETMELRVESICCSEIRKLEEKIAFKLTLDALVERSKRQYRYIAYKMFTQWGHGHMGKWNRTPVPSCAVYLIRLKFPEPDAEYTGFSYADEVLANAMPM
ncbi:hypothetical protein HOLleu_42523 [Holothuria leucospilota]|uniref:P2X purinoreceptor 7 intracellular domain-containing protein n=1 Tax=Holothuria leucospilota TaxID=206669 RepID=A0A9Q0YCX2_HOLLE|nr:hypothetical protein HOLleu_42523 [Holothuria leucospilota]